MSVRMKVVNTRTWFGKCWGRMRRANVVAVWRDSKWRVGAGIDIKERIERPAGDEQWIRRVSSKEREVLMMVMMMVRRRKEGRKKKKKKGKKGKEGGENLFVHSTCTIMYVATQQQQQCLCCVTTALRSQHSRVLDQWVTNHVLTTRWPRAHRGSTWTLTRACHGPTRNALRVHRQWLNGLFFFSFFVFQILIICTHSTAIKMNTFSFYGLLLLL